MKPLSAAATVLAAILLFHPDPALSQVAAATAGVLPEGVSSAGLPAPDEPATASNGGVEYGRSWSLVAGQPGGYYAFNPPSVSSGLPTTVFFSQPEPKGVDTLQEDLNVMSLLLQKKLEDAVGENSPTYRMGIPLLLRSGKRGMDSLYLDGFGALFTASINFPLVEAASGKTKEPANTSGSDDWNQARKELYGIRDTREAMNPFGSEATPYDAEQVGALKRALMEGLKNAANIRGLRPDESVVVTVFGTESAEAGHGVANRFSGGGAVAGGSAARFGGSGSASGVTVAGANLPESVTTLGSSNGRGTVLTVRVKKADAEAYSKGSMDSEGFQKKVTVTAYIGSSVRGGGSSARGGSYPNIYSTRPVSVAR